MIKSESLESSYTMLPQPEYKRARRSILNYLVVGLTFILVSISIIGVVHLYRIRGNGFPNSQQQKGHHNISMSSNKNTKTAFHEEFSESETQIINKLRNATQQYFTKPYMEDDSYLVKWLRECDWNFDEAKDMMLQHFEWRKEKNIDNILQEDFSYWEEEFPYYTDGTDFQGRPVSAADISLWDLRKVATSGRSEELLRYGHFQIEKGIQQILQAQAEGKNVTQAILIANLDHFNLAQHACFKCIPILVEYLFDAANHYPGWLYRIILINTPETFELILSLAAPATRGDNQDAIKVFGTNSKEWQEEVFGLIPRNQLRPRFGGSKDADDAD